jgi:hypothetical protein
VREDGHFTRAVNAFQIASITDSVSADFQIHPHPRSLSQRERDDSCKAGAAVPAAAVAR